DIFGAPDYPPRIDPPWLTTIVTRLTEAIYRDKTFDRLPILADALEEAGCTSRKLLKHMRSNAEHVRGCWAMELILAGAPQAVAPKVHGRIAQGKRAERAPPWDKVL